MTDNKAIESTQLLACPFCGETPTHQPPDHLGPFVWHSSPWCPIAAPVKFKAEVWNRREQAKTLAFSRQRPPLVGSNALLGIPNRKAVNIEKANDKTTRDHRQP